ncbi:MAG: GFA family protein [Pseudomonadota bacterium]
MTVVVHTGGCQCRHIRYQISTDPIVAYCCHCTDCQQQSSSAFGISVWFAQPSFKLTNGRLSFWKTKADSGNEKSCAYCKLCGTRIYHAFTDQQDILSVKGGSLDNRSGINPAGHIWTRSALSWMRDSLVESTSYDTEPEDFEVLIRLFRYSHNQ